MDGANYKNKMDPLSIEIVLHYHHLSPLLQFVFIVSLAVCSMCVHVCIACMHNQ